jgi:hypothetical protein
MNKEWKRKREGRRNGGGRKGRYVNEKEGKEAMG